MEKEYITPTREHPVFRVINTYEGYIVNDYCLYKDWSVENEQCHAVGETTAINLPDAMQYLFEHIRGNPDKLKAKYAIEMINGTADRYGYPVYTTVYTISMLQAKKYGLI